MNPQLIDSFMGTEVEVKCTDNVSRWYIAKPYRYGDGLFTRIRHALMILGGTARAVVFAEDTFNKRRIVAKRNIKHRSK